MTNTEKVQAITDRRESFVIRNTINKDEFKSFIIDSIDFSDYQEKDNTLLNVFEAFRSEYFHASNRGNQQTQIVEWLQGLPSCISFPFYYYDIKKLLKTFGVDEAESFEDCNTSNVYFNMIATLILQADNRE